ncbi:hypothetical protein LCGC14_1901630 [marine sediment metagenome]|uniref:Uncharacterized protein n=1 Tax=marine sediment metagenome TaxID=412755 RepID=A0A0F9FWR2_9ZZZZ
MVSARSFITEYITFLEKFDEEVEKIGIAANTKFGVTEVLVYDISENKIYNNLLNVD